MKRILPILLAAALLCGCSDKIASDPTGGSAGAANVDFGSTDNEMFTDRDKEQTWENGKTVTLSGDTDVSITAEGTYILSGSLNGCVTVDAPDNAKIQLVLQGVSIHNETGPAICILSANKVFVTLAEGTENTLSCGETLETVGEYDVDAALYSRCDLTLNGGGSLHITAPGSHGISGKDDLVVTGGNYQIHCAWQGLDANNSIRISGGSFDITAGKDGIHAEHNENTLLGYVYISGGSFDITAEGDGISASAWMQLDAAQVTILAGGGWENGDQQSSDNWGGMGPGFGGGGRPRSGDTSTAAEESSTSMKGLKAGTGIAISSGSYSIDSADDAIHSNTVIVINGGEFAISSGDDGVHAEETLTITACEMTVSHSYEGLEAEYVYVQGGNFTLTCSDDGINASGGNDGSGTGGRDQMFGGGMGGMGGSGNGAIEISGGTLHITSGGDGLDSNGSLTISGGYTFVTNHTSGDVSVLDSQQTPVITGGTYIGLGISTMMAQTFSQDSTQGVIACTVGSQSAGAAITITDKSGNTVITTQTEYSCALMIISSPDIVKGESYTVTIGSTSGTLSAS